MYLVYSFLLTLAFLFLLPYFIYQAFVQKKYLVSLRERLGRLPMETGLRPTLWIHAVSVGETLAARPILDGLRAAYPDHRLVISTTTVTGQAVARTRLREADGHFYFPFDFRFAVRRALDRVRPRAVILMESELWPNFLAECRRRGIPVVVANGRISDRSYARSRRVTALLGPVYRSVSGWGMQSERDAERAIALGAPASRVRVTGNIKYDLMEATGDDRAAATAAALDELFALGSTPLIVAGSTSEGEEEAVIASLAAVRRRPGLERTRLLIAPRHPERFDAVARLLEASGLTFVRRSEAGAAKGERALRGDIILLDSIGELTAVYRYASVVFVGGSLVPRGGHNILEPAASGRPIIVGRYMENFREIAEEFRRRDAVIQVSGGSEALTAAIEEVLADPSLAARLGLNARRAVEENRGATARTIEMIEEILEDRPPLIGGARHLVARPTVMIRSPLARALLYAPARLYDLGVRTRVALYETNYLATRRLEAPVISVGNLTVGGTGKTPLVAFLARYLRDEGLAIAILSRGYGRSSRGRIEVSDGSTILAGPVEAGDEPFLLARLCPGVRVVVDADRYAAGRWLEARAPVAAFILDDGFQHLQLARDLNLALVDATETLAVSEMVPFGRLREPLTSLRRADAVIVTRADQPFDQEVLRASLNSYLRPETPIFYAYHDLTGLRQIDGAGTVLPLNFGRRKVAAVSGVARPERFIADLRHYGLNVVCERQFRDHHRYTAEELRAVGAEARAAGAEALLTTEKDVANFPDQAGQAAGLPVYVAELEFRCEEEIALKGLVLRTVLKKYKRNA